MSRKAKIAISRIECYTARAKEKLESGDYRKVINALADIAEIGEIARRLYNLLQAEIKRL